MVSFSCEVCGDVLTKKKLDGHRSRCSGSSFTCIDCMVHFQGTDYRSHTSCISEAQKYQGSLYKPPKSKTVMPGEYPSDMTRYHATVEDESQRTVTTVDIEIPPRAPTPPRPGVNVFDFLVEDASQAPKHLAGPDVTYGSDAVPAGRERYDSHPTLPPAQATPAQRLPSSSQGKSDKKRKRVDHLSVSPEAPEPSTARQPHRLLHTGLTGGLERLVTEAEFYDDRIDEGPTPITPMKRSRLEQPWETSRKARNNPAMASKPTTAYESKRREHERREKDAREKSSIERGGRRIRRDSSSSSPKPSRHHKSRTASLQPSNGGSTSIGPTAAGQVRAERFISLISKGPDSDRGWSVNKTLKRYHREFSRDTDDKDLWRSLRLRKNEKGEVVLFVL
ncbi:hypothetical protein K470DRAFT_226126 [Piedraia hortae CBS 480.64]|uniref:Zinc finger C2H2 LYAR-type domain-containing protein n=1 Tax=Piedraia hortae CBS 480.64 TaxID=1314780 RepID=A0A6A7CAD2_9PEZI|nr:hypothetical protein K470DRAFT_226126 [Piedraia hortae CBS 480.64]